MPGPFDVIFVLPYPFSDHPSFPEGILKRALEREGFRAGVIETPFWQEIGSFTRLGRPKLFFAVVPGPVDSVILNYTSTRRRRKEDLYQFGGKAFFDGRPLSIKYKIRPDRATVVFSNRLKEAFKDVPIVIGGVEAALRRFCHYDFQQDKLRRSILFDARADILVAGMGEKQIVSIAEQLRCGIDPSGVVSNGIARRRKQIPLGDYLELPSFEAIEEKPGKLIEAQSLMEKRKGKGLAQRHGDAYVVEEPPECYAGSDLDRLYGAPYRRRHLKTASYTPALSMNLFSVTSHRGCGGGCSFCAIGGHQGRKTISRSVDSILRELGAFRSHPRWKGYVADVGGAAAEMYGSECRGTSCSRSSCLFPKTCRNLCTGRYGELLKACRAVKGVKKIFLGSGLRYDLMLKDPVLLEEIMVHHSGDFLRVAPEHTEEKVLSLMRKPPFEIFEAFVRLFNEINKRMKRKIRLAPYIIVGHPGETFRDVAQMRKKLRALNLPTTEAQVFTPSPGTIATAMYYAGAGPDFQSIPVTKRIQELQKRKDCLLNG